MTLDGIPVEVLGIGSGWTLVAVFVVLIYRGQLVPRKQYEDKEHEANEWRTELRLERQTNHELVEQNNLLLRDVAPAMTAFMASLQQAGEEHR